MRCDVAVVGGGPGGSVLAATLARRGARVALIDGSHPREKPCGGGYTGRALALLDRFVPTRELDAIRVRRATFLDSARAQQASVDLDVRDTTLVVASRAHVDGALFDAAKQAGAVIVPARATKITPGRPHRIALHAAPEIETPFIVGADGANSLVRRTFTSPFRRSQLSVATGFYAHGMTSDAIVLELLDKPAGYIWSFPRRSHLAIGICAQAAETSVASVRSVLGQWMAITGIGRGATLQPYSWPIPSLAENDFEQLTVGGDGWLTIGDAAGLVDPITREGIFFAIQSALIAADSLTSGSPAAYAERLRDELIDELAMAAHLKAGFFKPQSTRLLISALASSERIRRVMADLVSGTQPYRTLRRRLAATLELRLAWTWWRSIQRTA